MRRLPCWLLLLSELALFDAWQPMLPPSAGQVPAARRGRAGTIQPAAAGWAVLRRACHPGGGRLRLRARGAQAGGGEEWEDICGDGGCLKQVVTAGAGSGDDPRPRKGSVVQLHYEIRIDGEVLDRSSCGPDGEAFEFELGMEPSDAIAGWECAIPTMREGEIARLRCEPAYAFGPAGSPPKIPPNATIECTLELLSWVDKTAKWSRLADQYTGSDVPEEDIYAKYKEDLEVRQDREDGAGRSACLAACSC